MDRILTDETPENGPCWLNGVLPNDSNLYLFLN